MIVFIVTSFAVKSIFMFSGEIDLQVLFIFLTSLIPCGNEKDLTSAAKDFSSIRHSISLYVIFIVNTISSRSLNFITFKALKNSFLFE